MRDNIFTPPKLLTPQQISEIVQLRQTGHSLPEIYRIVDCGYGSVWRYIREVRVLPEYEEILRSKQGGSKERARQHWYQARQKAKNLIGDLSKRDFLIFMSAIYWGEGTKTALSLINGDPYLIRSFISGLTVLGIKKDEIRLHFRLFSDMKKDDVINYWLDFLSFDEKHVGSLEIIVGNGRKKLLHGMCRVTVIKGAPHFKQIMSMIDLIKSSALPS